MFIALSQSKLGQVQGFKKDWSDNQNSMSQLCVKNNNKINYDHCNDFQ